MNTSGKKTDSRRRDANDVSRAKKAAAPGLPNTARASSGAERQERRQKIPGSRKTALAFCPAAGKCGSCQYAGLTYEEQLKKKQARIMTMFRPLGRVFPIVEMENPLGYRNKVHAVFGKDRKGNVLCGSYQEGTHRIVSTPDCRIEDVTCRNIIRTVNVLVKKYHFPIYDEDTGDGLIRHVLVRRAFGTGEVMVILVLGTFEMPSQDRFIGDLLAVHPEITTILFNCNHRKTSMVLGRETKTVHGTGHITDEISGKKFRISPGSFYQVNSVQAESLYRIALNYAGLTGSEIVIDAFCGTGTMGILAADRAKSVTGVELSGTAVSDAKFNAKLNGVKNAEFFAADAADFLRQCARNGGKADVLILDPPRSGCGESLLSAVVKMGVSRIVYVSCEPDTLLPDAKFLVRNGYTFDKIRAVDMFPYTSGIEAVACLIHKNARLKDPAHT